MCVNCVLWLLCYATSPYHWHLFLQVWSFLFVCSLKKGNWDVVCWVQKLFLEIAIKFVTKTVNREWDKQKAEILWKLKTRLAWEKFGFSVLAVFQDVNVAKTGNTGYKWFVQSVHLIVMDCCGLMDLLGSNYWHLSVIHFVWMF